MKKRLGFDELEEVARRTDDIRPLGPALRRQWEAAKKSGARSRSRTTPNGARHISRIVPISLESALLERVDRYAKTSGVSRSTLVAEGLKLRMKP